MENNTARDLFFGADQPPIADLAVPEAPLVQASGFVSIEQVRAALEIYQPQVAALQARAEALAVDSDAGNRAAVELASQAKKVARAIEDLRKRFVAAPNEYVKAVNNLAKGLADPFARIEAGLKSKIGAWASKVELERRKNEEAARRAAAEVQASLDAEAKKAGVASVQVDAPVIPKSDTITRTEAGSAHQQKVWAFRVVDPGQVPREYLVVDERKLREAVKAGLRNIPGVEVFEESRTVIRG